MIFWMRLWCTASLVISTTSGRSRVRMANAPSRSLAVRASTAVDNGCFKGDGFSVDIAGLAQRIPKRVPDRSVVDDADARDFLRPRLRAGRAGRYRRAGHERYQLAAIHRVRLGSSRPMKFDASIAGPGRA